MAGKPYRGIGQLASPLLNLLMPHAYCQSVLNMMCVSGGRSAPSLPHLAARKPFRIHLQLPHRASETTNAMPGVSRCRQISAQAWQILRRSEAAGFPHDTENYAGRVREATALPNLQRSSRIPSITRRKAPASCRCMGTLGS